MWSQEGLGRTMLSVERQECLTDLSPWCMRRFCPASRDLAYEVPGDGCSASPAIEIAHRKMIHAKRLTNEEDSEKGGRFHRWRLSCRLAPVPLCRIHSRLRPLSRGRSAANPLQCHYAGMMRLRFLAVCAGASPGRMEAKPTRRSPPWPGAMEG